MSGEPSSLGRVSIVGAGQIGTALGMALAGSARVGLHDEDPARTREALDRGAGHEALERIEDALDAEVLILATPIPAILDVIERWGPSLRPGTLLLDTGSAKTQVVEAMRRSVPGPAVGGHPMAGTEVPGPAGVHPDLLRDATFALCAVRDDPEAMAGARRLAEAAGARPVEIAPEAHDAIVARTSHLPHLVAAALTRSAADLEGASSLAGPGFAGATRLIESDPTMVAGFLRANAAEVRTAARDLQRELDGLLERLGSDDLEEVLDGARSARRKVLG